MNQKKENFIRISENRKNKIIDLISKLHNLANSSFYEYSDEEIELMFNEIEKELKKQKQLLIQNNGKAAKRTEL